MGKMIDLTGIKFGRLTVKEKVGPGHNGIIMWRCECDCGNIIDVRSDFLRSGNTSSCGCSRRKKLKENEYDMSERYGKIIFKDKEVCIFDKEFEDVVKQYYWNTNHNNHVVSKRAGKNVCLSNLIFELAGNVVPNGYVVDHINRNPLDNRICNLRLSTYAENARNHSIFSNNTSGYTGVRYSKRQDSWVAYIIYNTKRIHLGTFKTKEDAILARREAEQKYFGRFAPH